MCAQNGSPVSEILMQWKSTYSISQNKCSTGGKELECSGSGAASCCRRFRAGGAGRTRVRLSCAGDSADATWVLSKGMQSSLPALLSPVSRHCCCLPAEARLAPPCRGGGNPSGAEAGGDSLPVLPVLFPTTAGTLLRHGARVLCVSYSCSNVSVILLVFGRRTVARGEKNPGPRQQR